MRHAPPPLRIRAAAVHPGQWLPIFGYTIPGVNFMLSFPVKPMLLQAAPEPFDSEEHVFEWKVDGVRCIMFYNNGGVRLQSKTGKDCTGSFPELLGPEVSAGNAVLDGEVTVLVNGRPDFEAVMERYLAGQRGLRCKNYGVLLSNSCNDIISLRCRFRDRQAICS